jgi:membrane protein DedA with SNARE-associated domain
VDIAAALPAVEGWGTWAYAAIFAVALFESTPLLGTAIPGATVVAVVGFAVSQGIFELGPSFWAVVAGAAIGDTVAYLIGRKSRGAFTAEGRWLNERHLERGQRFFARFGGASVFLGRFVGPLRATVPFVAGASRMHLGLFTIWNILSALPWAAAWMALGWISAGAITSLWQVAQMIF